MCPGWIGRRRIRFEGEHMRSLAVLLLVVVLSASAHGMADPAPATPDSKELLKAKKNAHDARQIADQLKDLPDDQFVAKWHALGLGETISEADLESGDIPRDDIGSLTSDINHENTDVNNLISDGFDEKHPRVVSMRAEIAAKQKQRHELIEKLKRKLLADAQSAEMRVKNLEAPPP
jgi:hypothetical protein